MKGFRQICLDCGLIMEKVHKADLMNIFYFPGRIKIWYLALLHASREGIAPFSGLAERGLLPDRTALLRVFEPHLTEQGLTNLTDLSSTPTSRTGGR